MRGDAREPVIPFAQPGSLTRVYAVASGKGGVGKSSVTVNLAAAMATRGLSVGVLDADIYGHSIPRMMGTTERPTQVESMILPPIAHDVQVISIAQFTQGNTPVVWRGPMLHRALQQFLADVYWGDLDVLLLDLPPGTGDVAISVAQLIPGAEILVVTTPQLAAAEVAERAGAIALQTRQRIVGVVENMSGLLLPDGTTMRVFGEGGGRQVAERLTTAVGADVPCSARCRWIPRSSMRATPGCRWCSAHQIRSQARSYAASPTSCRPASAAWREYHWDWILPDAEPVLRETSGGPLLRTSLLEYSFAGGFRTGHPDRTDGDYADPDGWYRYRRLGRRRLARTPHATRRSQTCFRRSQQAGHFRRGVVQRQQADRTRCGAASRRASTGLARRSLAISSPNPKPQPPDEEKRSVTVRRLLLAYPMHRRSARVLRGFYWFFLGVVVLQVGGAMGSAFGRTDTLGMPNYFRAASYYADLIGIFLWTLIAMGFRFWSLRAEESQATACAARSNDARSALLLYKFNGFRATVARFIFHLWVLFTVLVVAATVVSTFEDPRTLPSNLSFAHCVGRMGDRPSILGRFAQPARQGLSGVGVERRRLRLRAASPPAAAASGRRRPAGRACCRAGRTCR